MAEDVPALAASALPSVEGGEPELSESFGAEAEAASGAAPDSVAAMLSGREPVSWRFALSSTAAVALAGAWAALALARLGFLGWQCFLLRRFKQKCEETDAVPGDELRGLCREMGVRKAPRLLLCPQISSPMAVGYWQPAILMPARLLQESAPTDRNNILRHELAHLARSDDWANLFQQIVRAALFFHPGVWWLSRRLTLEREIACDDHVLAATRAPKAYALFLTEYAGRMKSRDWTAAPAAWSSSTQLKERITMILDKRRNASPRLGRTSTGISIAVVAVLAALAMTAGPRLAFAQAEPAAALPAPAPAPEAPGATPAPAAAAASSPAEAPQAPRAGGWVSSSSTSSSAPRVKATPAPAPVTVTAAAAPPHPLAALPAPAVNVTAPVKVAVDAGHIHVTPAIAIETAVNELAVTLPDLSQMTVQVPVLAELPVAGRLFADARGSRDNDNDNDNDDSDEDDVQDRLKRLERMVESLMQREKGGGSWGDGKNPPSAPRLKDKGPMNPGQPPQTPQAPQPPQWPAQPDIPKEARPPRPGFVPDGKPQWETNARGEGHGQAHAEIHKRAHAEVHKQIHAEAQKQAREQARAQIEAHKQAHEQRMREHKQQMKFAFNHAHEGRVRALEAERRALEKQLERIERELDQIENEKERAEEEQNRLEEEQEREIEKLEEQLESLEQEQEQSESESDSDDNDSDDDSGSDDESNPEPKPEPQSDAKLKK